MHATASLSRAGWLALFVLAGGVTAVRAQTASSASGSSSTTSRTSSASRTGSSAKTVLPDPALLDGSKQPAEKRPEYGMVGDFELPGDENARNNRVGGQQNQQAGAPNANAQTAGLPLPSQSQSGGAGSNQQPSLQLPQPQQQGGGGGGQEKDGQGQNGTAQTNGQSGNGSQMSGPQGQADGRQVGQLGGEAGAQDPSMASNKPGQMSIGDKGMRIETSPNVQGVIGEQTGQNQQHEKGTGTGGKNAVGNNGNRGAERGRTMPSGL